MQNLLPLMQTTLKLLWGFGTTSQSKLLLRSIIATVTEVTDGLLGTNQACLKHLKPLNLLRLWISIVFYCLPYRICNCLLFNHAIYYSWSRNELRNICNYSPLIQYVASWICFMSLILQCMLVCRKISLALHLCMAQSLVWTITECLHFWKPQSDKHFFTQITDYSCPSSH